MAEIGWQGVFTIAVVLVTLAMLLWERYSPDRVLVVAAGALLVSGVLTPAEALSGFWNPGVLTVAVLFVLVAALKTTGAIRWIGDWVLGHSRSTFRTQARLIAIAGPLSAFVNNTPVVATVTAAVEHWSRRSGIPPSRLLLPMNYATILGGMTTLLGTSTNLIVAGLVVAAGLPALDLFAPAGVGLAALLAGAVYLLSAGRWLLPERQSVFQQAADVCEYAVEMLVELDGPVSGQTIADAGLRRLEGSYLVELVREGRTHPAVSPHMCLQGADRLVFIGGSNAIAELRAIPGLRPATDQLFKLSGNGERKLVEVVLSAFNPAVGRTLVQCAFRSRYNAAVLAISRRGQRLHHKPGVVELQAGDTLLVETDDEFLDRHGTSNDFLVVTEIGTPARIDRKRAIATLAIVGLMVLANTLFGVEILWSAVAAAGAVLLAGCVNFRELRESLDLRLIAVIACSFALGAAIDKTGIADIVAGALGAWAGADPFWTLVFVYVVTVLSTELLTNNAAAVLMFPIGLAASQQLGVDPMPFVMAVMIGASAGFMSPIGYQTNLMIYGPGGYRFLDYVRVGAPLSVVVGVASLATIPYFWPF